MTETVSSKASADGWNEPTKNLPPMEVRELPEPLPLGKLIGASVILLATALGSGELLIWPYITTQAGVGLLWLATLGFLSQYFLNMEIERYTLATGETAVAGFARFWKPWGILFCFFAVIPNVWPGWRTAGATTFSYLVGGDPNVLEIIVLLAIGRRRDQRLRLGRSGRQRVEPRDAADRRRRGGHPARRPCVRRCR